MNQRAALSLRVPSRVGLIPEAAAPSASEDVAARLQEVARRARASDFAFSTPAGSGEARTLSPGQPERSHRIQSGRELAGLAALTAGRLQSCFLDTMVRINSLPKVAVFVPLGAG